MDITDVFGNYVMRDQRNDNAYHNKGFTSHEFDDTTGNIYAHARYLSAPMHSFNSVDPMLYKLPQSYLTDPQQMNSYAYARNNPIVYTDPTGEFIFALPAVSSIIAGVAAIAAAVGTYLTVKQTVNDYNAYKTASTPQVKSQALNHLVGNTAVNTALTVTGLKAASSIAGKGLNIGTKSSPELKNGAQLLTSGDKPAVVRHYSNETNINSIVDSKKILPSTKASNPNDAYYGDGQYFTDIEPGTYSDRGLSSIFIRKPAPNKYTHFVEISTDGLDIAKGRKGVFVVPNDEPLDIMNRLIRYGKNQ